MPVVESCVYLHVTICMMSVATKNVYFVILNKRYSTSLSTAELIGFDGWITRIW